MKRYQVRVLVILLILNLIATFILAKETRGVRKEFKEVIELLMQ